jgi:hypothetical protein
MDQLALILVGVVVVLGGLYWLLSRGLEDKSTYYFRCKACKQRLKYQAKQVGKGGICPSCNTRFVFPPITKKV